VSVGIVAPDFVVNFAAAAIAFAIAAAVADTAPHYVELFLELRLLLTLFLELQLLLLLFLEPWLQLFMLVLLLYFLFHL
jgi:hypothetical protein